MYMENVGWQVNELIEPIYDVKRELPVGMPDGKAGLLTVIGNTSHPLDEGGVYEVRDLEEEAQNNHLHTGKGEFDVTISTGPSYQSQREQASEFVDHLIANWQALAIPQPIALKILALGVKLKSVGPIGDEIQDLLNPPSDFSDMPPAAQAAITQLQGQLQALQQENMALHEDRAGRVLEQQTKIALQQMKDDNANLRTQLQNDIKVLTSLIQAKNAREDQEAEMYKTFWMENHKATHESATQGRDHAHEHAIADKQAQIAKDQLAATQAHEAGENAADRTATAQEGAANREAAAQSQEEQV